MRRMRRQGGTHISSGKRLPDLLQCLIVRYRFDTASPNIIAPAASLGSPKLADVAIFCRVKAFYEAVSE